MNDYESQLNRWLDGELSEAEAAAFERDLAENETRADEARLARELNDRVRSAHDEQLDQAQRDQIWNRFEAGLSDLSSSPPDSLKSESFVDWRLFALPVAASLLGLALWGAGLFDAKAHEESVGNTNSGAQAELVDGTALFRQSPIIEAVMVGDREFRGDLNRTNSKSDHDYGLRQALTRRHSAIDWLGDRNTTVRSARLEEVEEIARGCMAMGGDPFPPLPKDAVIEACSVHEVPYGEMNLRIPHLVLDCSGQKVSAYYICGSLRPAIEKAMAKCGSLDTTSLKKDTPTLLHRCPECSIFAMLKGHHVLLLVSDLEHSQMKKLVARF